MTDRPSDLDDARLHADLATWFEGEVRQAALDLRRAPLRPARARRTPSRSIAAPAAGAILVTILVVAGISRLPSLTGPATEPTGSAVPTASAIAPEPTPTGSPEPGPSIDSRYDDGIPAFIDGERVVRPSTIDRLGPADDRPFLLGGWLFDYKGIVLSCAIMIDPIPFGPRCMSPYMTDVPILAFAGRVVLEDWTVRTGGGPVVFRVHRHDPRSADCIPERREACEDTAVYEATVWAGDDMTAADPLTPTEVVTALLAADSVFGEASLTAVPDVPEEPIDTSPDLDDGRPITPFSCRPQYPPMAWSVSGAGITSILAFPTTADREAVDQDFLASGWRGANGCRVYTDAAFLWEWVAVDNVMVAVLVDVDGANPTQAALVDAVREALEGP